MSSPLSLAIYLIVTLYALECREAEMSGLSLQCPVLEQVYLPWQSTDHGDKNKSYRVHDGRTALLWDGNSFSG